MSNIHQDLRLPGQVLFACECQTNWHYAGIMTFSKISLSNYIQKQNFGLSSASFSTYVGLKMRFKNKDFE